MKEKIKGISLTKRLEQIEPLLEKDRPNEAWNKLKEIESQGDIILGSLEKGIFYYVSAVTYIGYCRSSVEFGNRISFTVLESVFEPHSGNHPNHSSSFYSFYILNKAHG